MIVGIGVNVASHPQDTPYPATSLRAQGIAIEPRPLLEAICHRLATNYRLWCEHGFRALRSTWLARSTPSDALMRLRTGDWQTLGSVHDIDEQGALLLRTDDGRIRRFTAGELLPASR